MKRYTYSVFILLLVSLINSCGQPSNSAEKKKTADGIQAENQDVKKYKVTFVELGSVKCIPCQQMQPVLKSVEAKYGRDVRVVFHDVWTEAGKPFAVKYRIDAIPTQVFLDDSGNEYFRHTGFFPEEEVVKVLKMKGIKVN